jgi:hypothetical protein
MGLLGWDVQLGPWPRKNHTSLRVQETLEMLDG